MTAYTVEWLTDAEDDLTTIYLQANDKTAVTKAQAVIDKQLANSPRTNGIHLHEGLWRIEVQPLTAHYTIDEAKKIVEVYQVSRIP